MCFCEVSAFTGTNCMATLLMPLPDSDFDPTESGVPWCTMRDHGHNVVFATPTGRTAHADPKMESGEGLGILSPLLKAESASHSQPIRKITSSVAEGD